MFNMTRGRVKTNKGFTLIEILIVVAIIAILLSIAIPRFSKQLEKAREATDLANVRSAYACVMAAVITDDTSSALYDSALDEFSQRVELNQKQDGWVTNTASMNIGGIYRSDSAHWKGDAKAGGSCVVVYNRRSSGVTLIWDSYSVYPNYQWIENSNGVITVDKRNWSDSWPCAAITEFIPAKNGTGQKVVVKKISDQYPNLQAYLEQGGGYEIGIFITDTNGKILWDSYGRPMSAEEDMEFEIETDEVADGEDVKIAIQFFKMKSGSNRGLGSVEMPAADARELENIFTVTDSTE